MYSYGSPHMAGQKQDDQHEHTFSSYVRIQDVVLKTYLGRWTIGRSGKRGSGISVLPARYDDDDDDDDDFNLKKSALRCHFLDSFNDLEITSIAVKTQKNYHSIENWKGICFIFWCYIITEGFFYIIIFRFIYLIFRFS